MWSSIYLPTKMEELKFEAPLAQLEDFVDLCSDLQNLCDLKSSNFNMNGNSAAGSSNSNGNSNGNGGMFSSGGFGGDGNANSHAQQQQQTLQQCAAKGLEQLLMKQALDEDNNDVVVVEGDGVFTDTFSGSLEDLVNTFDEKITKCFNNLDETTEKLAPVQMRTQEELMNDCQMWWTITGNYGNIQWDWSKTYARKLQIPTLNLNEQVASDLDMHSLILGRAHEPEPEPPTADEVIKEIDFIMQETPESECCSEGACSCQDSRSDKAKFCTAPFYREKLNELSLNELNELLIELEAQIKDYSEVLINELALRDELEFEKELKNSFISHLLAVQTKRRQHNLDRKKNKVGEKGGPPNGTTQQSKYLTTVIPYHAHNGPPTNPNLQVLIKILKAIEQDSPAVPTLLTDYILKVLCPT
ncbi:fasciculation and elongation protein zeta-2 isoform X2 [Folsomia candida]|uniref:fasciculation and elongation protein zeta-2 isoform X2 n=1 Tax=Folsomia candida TaxID=158441 RepID=UPI000B8F1FC5|nr:fasciculation and elongation protein zeta-2 isoform X2 [Folsomia candida]